MLVLSMSTDLKNRSSKADSKAWISERNGVAPGNSIRLDYGTFHEAGSEACGMTPLSARWSLGLWGRIPGKLLVTPRSYGAGRPPHLVEPADRATVYLVIKTTGMRVRSCLYCIILLPIATD